MYVGEMLNKCMVYGGVCEYRFFFVCVVDVRMWVRFVTMKVTAVTVGTKRKKTQRKIPIKFLTEVFVLKFNIQ